jgi:hypothetical protein
MCAERNPNDVYWSFWRSDGYLHSQMLDQLVGRKSSFHITRPAGIPDGLETGSMFRTRTKEGPVDGVVLRRRARSA